MPSPEEKNQLEAYRSEVLRGIERTRDEVRSKKAKEGYVSQQAFLRELHANLAASVKELSPDFPFGLFDIDFIERGNFHADVVFKSTALMSQDKGRYFKEFAPGLLEILQKVSMNGKPFFEGAQIVGIYVNAKLHADSLFSALGNVLSLGARYGENDSGKGQDMIVEYSSPNAAKHLHAGHIRSTIIGHVFANIYEASGYTVHRFNYLNDWGGMGFLMEGLSKRSDVENYENKNDLLFEIYSTFRKAQKAAESNENFAKLDSADVAQIKGLIGDFSDYPELASKFAQFVERSNARFAALENGESEAYSIWRQIVEWSMADFEKFYDILGIHHDYLTSEGLYAKSGKDLILSEAQEGKILFFDEQAANDEIAVLQAKLDAQEITSEVFERKKQETLADIGSYVVPLENHERFVVLKKDGSTIYATRDMAVIEHRVRMIEPKKMVYEVGQEQQEHFDKLFKSAKAVGIAGETELKHVYHGFYVDEATKKKLSSRDGASNIMKLLNDTVAFFESKYDGNDEFTTEEKKHIARTLGVGSIIFNDIKRDRKSAVGISSDFEKMMKQFEEAGGAYLIYASCRAKSILRKYAKPLPDISSVNVSELLDIEADLIKKILSFPDIVKKAGESDDPVKISEFLTALAATFNSYYNSVPILKGNAVEQGILIAHCVSVVIDSGLRILHVGTLDRI